MQEPFNGPFLEVPLGTMPMATSIILVEVYAAEATLILSVSRGTPQRDYSKAASPALLSKCIHFV
jgi:hypothetical protein